MGRWAEGRVTPAYRGTTMSEENSEWCGKCEQYHDVVIDQRKYPHHYEMDDLWEEDDAPAT